MAASRLPMGQTGLRQREEAKTHFPFAAPTSFRIPMWLFAKTRGHPCRPPVMRPRISVRCHYADHDEWPRKNHHSRMARAGKPAWWGFHLKMQISLSRSARFTGMMLLTFEERMSREFHFQR